MRLTISPDAAFIQRRIFPAMSFAPRVDGYWHMLLVAILTGLVLGLTI